MSQFDANEYFNRLSANTLSANTPGETQDKLTAIVDARRRAVEALNSKALGIELRKQAVDEASKNSWVTQQGLDPDSVTGRAANLGASLYSGASRVVGDVVGFVGADAEAMIRDASLSDEQISAVGRFKQGIASPEDVALINARKAEGAQSPLEMFDKATEARTRSGNIADAFDRSGTVHTGRRDELSEQLGSEFQGAWDQTKAGASMLWDGDIAGSKDLASGLAKLVYNAGEAAVTNPGAAAEYIAENIPQLGLGLLGSAGKAAMLTSNVGYASESYQKGIAKYQAENKGAYPPAEARQEMALYAASMALAEQVGDVSLLKGARGAAEAVTNTGKTGLIQSLKNTADAALKGTGAEALTEGWQTFAEGKATLTPVTAAEIYEGAVIGGMVGGGLAGGGRAVGELLKAGQERVEETEVAQTIRAAQEAAIASGDVSALTDPQKPTYAPSKAISALAGHSALATTTPEAREANLAKATDIVAKLENQRNNLRAQLEETTPEGQAKLADQLVKAKAVGDPELVAFVEEQQTKSKALTPTQKRSLETQVRRLDTELAQAEENLSRFTRKTTVAEAPVEEVAALIKEVAAPQVAGETTEKRTTAARKLVLLSMTADVFDDATATTMADDTTLDLSEGERGYLRKFSEARIAANRARNTEQVSKEVLYGSKENRGLVQYAKLLAASFKGNNRKTARLYMDQLEAFQTSHTNKVAAIDEALKLGNGKQIESLGDGQWRVSPVRRSDSWLKENGGLTLNSPELITAIRAEATAITATRDQMLAAYDLKFSPSATTQGAPNVPVVPQAPAQAQDGSVAEQTPAVVGSNEQASGSDVAVTPSVGTAPALGVEAAGVAPTGAAGWVLENARGTVELIRKSNPKLLDQVEELHAQDLTAGEIAKRLGVEVDLVRDLRNGLGLPSQGKESGSAAMVVPGDAEERAKFKEWVAQRNKAPQDPNAAPPWDDIPVDAYIDSDQETGPAETTETTRENSETQVATDLKESPEGTSVTVSESQEKSDPTQRTEGQLEIFQEQEEGNAVAAGFTQEAAREGDTTARPLVAVKDFWETMLDQAQDFLAEKLTSEQKATIQAFSDKVLEWSGTIARNLPKRKDPRFRHEDVMQYLLKDPNREGELSDMDQNIFTAISYGAFNYLAAEANSPAEQSRESVNKILGKKKSDWMGGEAYARLGKVGVYQHLLMDEIGGAILDALGFKAKDTTPQDLEPKLRAALGYHGLKLMEDLGYITRTTIMADEMAALRKEETKPADSWVDRKGVKRYKPHYFFAITRESDGQPVQAVREIAARTKKSQGVLEKLFKVSSRVKVPLLAPNAEVSRTTKGTNMETPGVLKNILVANQANARRIRPDLLGFLTSLPKELVEAMIGMTPNIDQTVHISNRSGAKARNEALWREYENLVEFAGEYLGTSPNGLETDFFLEFAVWKQQRVGVATTIANPQTSKVARQLVYSQQWETEVKSDDPDLMASFYLRVAEGLGMKTERQDNLDSVLDVIKTLLEPKYDNAIQALRKTIRREALLASEEDAIVDGVLEGGENLHSLNALLAVAYKQEAEAKAGEGQPYTFTSKVMGEVDGVANGTMLSHILLGAAGTPDGLQAMMVAGGFFDEASEQTQYNQWRGSDGNLDIYESTVKLVHKAVQEFIAASDESIQNKINRVWAIAGDIFDEAKGTVTKDGRNLIKEALNPLMFGSGMVSVVEGMSNAFLARVRSEFEKLAENEADQAEVDTFIGHLNALAGSKVKPLPLGRPITWHMNQHLNPAYEAMLKRAFSETVGQITSDVVGERFAPYLERRDNLNQVINITHGLSEAIYRGERDAYIEELVEKGEIPLSFKGERIGDLSKKQEKELQKRTSNVAPLIQTIMSKVTGGRKAGLRAAKRKRRQNASPEYSTTVQFGSPLQNDKNSKSVAVRGFSSQEEAPGVAIGSALVHSLDSYISHMVQKARDVLNIHDAVGDGVGGLRESAALMNQYTWQAVLTYSPMEEAHQSLATVVRGLAYMYKKGQLSPQAMANVQKYLGELEAGELSSVLVASKQEAYAADKIKLEFLSKLVAVDQYAFQGGNYLVTDSDRAQAAQMIKDLKESLSDRDKGALKIIEALMTEKPGAIKTTPVMDAVAEAELEALVDGDTEADTESIVDLDQEEAPPVGSPFGTLGKPKRLNEELRQYFAAGERTPAEVLKKLWSLAGTERTYTRDLIKMLSGALPKDLKIKIITKDTKRSEVPVSPAAGAPGFYYDGVIYLLNEDFEESALHGQETMLHEVVHGVLEEIMETELAKRAADPKYTSAVLDQIGAIEALMNDAYEAFDETQRVRFKAAFENVHEFIAYGMTRKVFQQALAKVNATKKSNGLKELVAKLVGILFSKMPKTNLVAAESVLAQLIENVAGLVEATQERQGKKVPSPPRAMTLDPADQVQDYTTVDIHNALNGAGMSSEFDTHLQGILSNLALKLHGPWGAFKAGLMARQAMTPLDVWLKALDTGAAPFASSLQGSPIPISQKELHAMEQVEATVRAALEANEVTTKVAYKELRDLYAEMRTKIKPSDFVDPAHWDYVFKIESDGANRSDYLARFAAFTLAHEGFNTLMQRPSEATPKKKAKSFVQRMQRIFDKILTFFAEKLTHTYSGQPADAKLTRLVEQLVDIEAKRRKTIEKNLQSNSVADTIEKGTKAATEMAKDLVVKAANTKLIKESRFTVVKLGGSLARIVAKDQTEQLMNTLADFRNKYVPGLHGLPTELLNQTRGFGKLINMLQLSSTRMQALRKEIMEQTAATVMKSFKDQTIFAGNEGHARKGALTQVILRTGMHLLRDQFDMAQLLGLITNKAALKSAIADTEKELRQVPKLGKFADHYIHQANGLGYARVTGAIKREVVLMNAHNIARLYDTKYSGQVPEASANVASEIIGRLVSLYALEYTSAADKKLAAEVMKAENDRTDGNGVEFTIALQKRLDQESRDTLFAGQEALMTHGYIPESYNPHTDVKVTTADKGKALTDQGYTLVGPVVPDVADPDTTTKYMYVLRDGGQARYQTGIMLNTGMKAKGTPEHSGYLNPRTEDGTNNRALNSQIIAGKNRELQTGPRVDLSTITKTYMAPVVNPDGKIVNWRYLMQDKTKDSILERDNRFEEVLGTFAGSVFDKQTTTETNTKAIKALYEAYKLEEHRKEEDYVLVGPDSKEAELRETWNLLPKETKEVIKSVFGNDGMLVRKEFLLPVFGYRKFSLAESFKKDPRLVKNLERLFVDVIEGTLTLHAKINARRKGERISAQEARNFAKRAAVLITRGERGWQDVVHEIKDIIVVKTLIVTIDNIWSNLSYLVLLGVPIKSILKDHVVAYKAVTDYEADYDELTELELLQRTGQTVGRPQIAADITRLKDAIARNPVKYLIDEGLMPTIVEDVTIEDDPYSYKAGLAKKLERYTSKLNPTVVSLARGLYMTHDTKGYQLASRVTRLSDFVARYTLYQHLTTRKENVVAKKDAINEASETFVNYDSPLPKKLQYIDDMGIVPFLKYYLRIQRILMKLARDSPARVVGGLLLDNYAGLGPIVLESSWIHKFGNNPLQMGALKWPTVVDDIATLALIKSGAQ
jgi:hypothetical protein